MKTSFLKMSLSKFNPLKLLISRYCTGRPREAELSIKIIRDRRQFSETLFFDFLTNQKKIEPENWPKIREELLAFDRSITPTNVDSIILDTCCTNSQHDAALNYVDYLKRNNYKLNVGTIGKWMVLVSKKDEMSEKEKNDVIEIYDNLRKDYPLLDPTTAGSCMTALSKTKRWRDALELRKMTAEITKNIHHTGLTSIISAAFDNNEAEIGWEIMRDLVLNKGIFSKDVYTSYLNYSLRVGKNEAEIEEHIGKLFEFLGQWDLYPWISVMKEYSTAMGKFGWKGETTEIKRNGMCKNCGESLSELNLTEKEFNYLSSKFMERAVVGSDVYNKTTPKELVNFKAFIEKSKPYDIVIDGLNVEYTMCGNRTVRATGNKLAQVVRFLVDKKKKIIVLGRKHMTRWQRDPMSYIQRNASLFFADDTSADDPYLLWATLAGGQNTQFVSRDLMRQHKFLLDDPELQRIFKLWQLARQIQPQSHGHQKNYTTFLAYPPSYAPVAQKNNNTWHLPCVDDSVHRQVQLYSLSQPWYCLRKDHEKTTTNRGTRKRN